MKTSLTLLLLLSAALNLNLVAQNVTLTATGHVYNLNSMIPVANHPVAVKVASDSSLTPPYYFTDTTFTSPDGAYTLVFPLPWVPDTVSAFSISTPDCNGFWASQCFSYTGQPNPIVADFHICHDTVPPPSPCTNMIEITGIQGLTVSLNGSLLNGGIADYFWDFGDGSTGTGQNEIHTYSQSGMYSIMLQTITPDSCIDINYVPLMIGDSIPNGCPADFFYQPTGIPYEVAFSAYTNCPPPNQFTWDFGDGTSGSGDPLTHAYCCPGAYLVTLTVTNGMGVGPSVVQHSVFIPQDTIGGGTITGFVYAGNLMAPPCEVTLFQSDSLGGYFPLTSISTGPDGGFSFPQVPDGIYLLLATPYTAPGIVVPFMPTYYGNVAFWQQATEIILGDLTNPYNINLLPMDSLPGGNGNISGNLTGNGKSVSPANQLVYLLNINSQIVGYTYTDMAGHYTFSNLPLGTYTVFPTITGYTTNTWPITLTSGNFTVVANMTISGNTILGNDKSTPSALKTLSPNPCQNELHVALKSIVTGTATVYSATGRMMSQKEIQSLSTFSIPVDKLPAGVYILEIKEENGNISKSRFVKK